MLREDTTVLASRETDFPYHSFGHGARHLWPATYQRSLVPVGYLSLQVLAKGSWLEFSSRVTT